MVLVRRRQRYSRKVTSIAVNLDTRSKTRDPQADIQSNICCDATLFVAGLAGKVKLMVGCGRRSQNCACLGDGVV